MKKHLQIAGESLAEALCDGAFILPSMTFAGMIYMHYGEARYFLPIVLFYASEKAMLFYMASLGKTGNPFRILTYSMRIAVTGSILLCFGGLWAPLWDAGAVLLGTGLCAFQPLYRTLQDALRKNGFRKKNKSSLAGLLLFGIFLGLSALLRHAHLQLVFVLLLALLLGVAFFLQKIDVSGLSFPRQLWVPDSRGWKRFVLPTGILLALLLVSLFQQTAGTIYLILMTAVAFLTLMMVLALKGLYFRPCTARCMWFGALQNFLSVFSLISLTALGKNMEVMIAYGMIVVGTGAARVLAAPFARVTGEKNFENGCIIGSVISLLPMLTGSIPFYMIAVALACAFAAMGTAHINREYLMDETVPEANRRFAPYKIYNLGGISQQLLMMLFFAASACFYQIPINEPMNAYTYRNAAGELEPVFASACLMCIITLALFGLLAILFGRKNRGKIL